MSRLNQYMEESKSQTVFIILDDDHMGGTMVDHVFSTEEKAINYLLKLRRYLLESRTKEQVISMLKEEIVEADLE